MLVVPGHSWPGYSQLSLKGHSYWQRTVTLAGLLLRSRPTPSEHAMGDQQTCQQFEHLATFRAAKLPRPGQRQQLFTPPHNSCACERAAFELLSSVASNKRHGHATLRVIFSSSIGSGGSCRLVLRHAYRIEGQRNSPSALRAGRVRISKPAASFTVAQKGGAAVDAVGLSGASVLE